MLQQSIFMVLFGNKIVHLWYTLPNNVKKVANQFVPLFINIWNTRLTSAYKHCNAHLTMVT